MSGKKIFLDLEFFERIRIIFEYYNLNQKKPLMKKFLLLIVLGLFFFSGIAYAQDQPTTVTPTKKKPTFWYGPKVGMDMLTPTLDQNTITQQVKSNYQAGIFFQFGRKFYFQPEFYYGVQNQNVGSQNEVTINTLKVPMMFGMRLINLKVISAHIMAGPSLSYLLHESVTDPNMKKTSFALQAGGGIDVLGFITLDVRYSVDLNNSMNQQVKQLGWDSGVNVTLGLKLR